MKRGMVARVMVALLAAVVAVGLAACGNTTNDEEVIREGITAELDLLKNPTEENLSEYMEGVDPEDLASITGAGIDIYEMLGHLLGKFDYTIGDITVDGDTATAAITVTNVDIQKAMSAATDAIGSEENTDAITEAYQAGDEEALMQLILSFMYDAIDNTTEVVSNDVEVSLVKSDNTWDFDEKSFDALSSAVYGGFDFSSLT